MASRACCAAAAAVSPPIASTKAAVTAALMLTDDSIRKGAALPAKQSREYQRCEQRFPYHLMILMSHKATMTMLL